MSFSGFGFAWWKWSALCAAIVGALELLVLVGFAVLGQIEFAVLGMYFVVSAISIALVATGLLILFWLLLISIAPLLRSNRSWLVVYIAILGWPLYFGPISSYEWALAAPTILGLILPRFLVSRLKTPEIYVSRSGQAA